MTEWYSHLALVNEGIVETKSELASLVARNPTVQSFLRLQVQYLELIRHRALNEQKGAADGVDLALIYLKQLVEPTKKYSEENEDE